MNTTLLKVFVYGTLKPGESYYQKYGLDCLSQAEKATAIGSLYHLPRYHYPAMGKGYNTVWGYVLQISHPRVLNELDYLEGYIKGIIPTGNSYLQDSDSNVPPFWSAPNHCLGLSNAIGAN